MRNTDKLKNILFFTVLGALALVGTLWFLRPEVSELEKRELTRFPRPTLAGLADGSFTGGVDKWYADTYPLREPFIRAANRLRSLYGDRSERIIIRDDHADRIPDAPPDTAPDTTPDTGPDTPPDTTPDTSQGGAGATGEVMGSVYVVGECGYSLYYFSEKNTARYARILDRAQEACGEDVQVYSLPIPLSSGVILDEALQKSVGASDQKAAIDYINSLFSSSVRGLNVFDTLKAHSGEYIYFRTDHHWTALGAYYAYVDLCAARGVEPHRLDQFERMEFPGFLGSFYSDTLSEAMKRDPDTVTAYVPMGTNEMIFRETGGEERRWNVVRNVKNNGSGAKYYCFAGSDHPYSYAHNPEINDGSACVVVKDSFGNALVPFLIDHYEHIYWIDFRYYKGTLQDLAREEGVDDVIFCLNLYNTTSSGALGLLDRLVP